MNTLDAIDLANEVFDLALFDMDGPAAHTDATLEAVRVLTCARNDLRRAAQVCTMSRVDRSANRGRLVEIADALSTLGKLSA